MDALDVGPDVLNDLVGVVAEGPGVDDGVAPVHKNVGAGVEHPVDTHAGRLAPGHVAHVVGGLSAAAGGGLRRSGYKGAVAQAAVAAVVTVGGNQQGNAGGLLIGFVLLINLLAVAALPA